MEWRSARHNQGALFIPFHNSTDHLQPDIVFFGEDVDVQFDRYLYEDREKVDLLIVMGTSLKVAPVNQVLSQSAQSAVNVADEEQLTSRIPYRKYTSTSNPLDISIRM